MATTGKPLTLASLNLTDNYGAGEEWMQRPGSRSRPSSGARRKEAIITSLPLSADEFAPIGGHSHHPSGAPRLPPLGANSNSATSPSASFVDGTKAHVPNRKAPASFMRKGSARNGGKPLVPRGSGGGLSGLGLYAADDPRPSLASTTPSPTLGAGNDNPYQQGSPPNTPPLAAYTHQQQQQQQLLPSASQQQHFNMSQDMAGPPPMMPPGWAAWQAERAGWSQSSVGDLEALDSILDHLVVLDARMRGALMRGPAISFETVVPETRGGGAGGAGDAADDPQDLTFLTSVKVAGQEDEEDEEEGSGGRASDPSPTATFSRGDDTNAAALSRAPPNQRVGLHSGGNSPVPGMSHLGMSHGYGGLDKLTITVATPVMPRLTRLYLGNKAAQLSKAPPAPPATAEYLLRSRPPPFISAPSYDALCNQIQSVQRQYTCGTSGRDTSPGRPMMDNAMQTSNYNQYISGLDGPSLDTVVNTVDLPIVLERARPSFVTMRKSARKKSRARDRASPRSSPPRRPVPRSAPIIGVDGIEGYGNNSGGEYTDSD